MKKPSKTGRAQTGPGTVRILVPETGTIPRGGSMQPELKVRDPGEEGNVFLGSLPVSFTVADIKEEFSSYGGKS